MGSTTKSRTIPIDGAPGTGFIETWVSSPGGSSAISRTNTGDLGVTYARYLSGSQITASENHPEWLNAAYRRRHPLADIGGEFSSFKRYAWVEGNTSPRELVGIEPSDFFQVNHARYIGPILPCSPSLCEFPAFANSSDAELRALGTTAIARCSPSNPSADLSTFLGELSGEGLPRIVGGSLKSLRSMSPAMRRKALADEHLNFQFGWLPFVNDVRQLAHSISHANGIISQYLRDSGKVVRRRYGFPAKVTTESSVYLDKLDPWIAADASPLRRWDLPASGKVYRSKTTTKLQYFSGAFTYYLPPSSEIPTTDSVARKIILAKKLVGARATPGAVWNLAPWSWAVDWFSNVGDLTKNLDNWIIDNQVLVYGYIMEHTLSEYVYTYAGPDRFRSGPVYPPNVHMVSETRRRLKATPYGFGLKWGGLTALQQSILVALGISRWRE